tara:strand:+ start:3307 stop:4122 length:816 start_codon:yes stop_codon:yes gene_type:complete
MKPIALFMIVFIIIILGIVVIQQSASNAELIDRGSDSSSGNILADNGTATTLSPVGVGITSNTATANNNSWLEFDGVNDFINTSQSDLELDIGTLNYTISLWLKSGIKQPTQYRRILEYGGYAEGGYSIQYTTYGPQVRFYYANASAWECSHANLDITTPVNEWTNLIYIFNGTTIKSLKDGNLIGSEANCSYTSIQDNLHIGSTTGTLMGIDEIRIYNQSLSDSQASQIYNSGRQANSSLSSDGLVLWYSFNEGSGTTVYDKSGNGNNGE